MASRARSRRWPQGTLVLTALAVIGPHLGFVCSRPSWLSSVRHESGSSRAAAARTAARSTSELAPVGADVTKETSDRNKYWIGRVENVMLGGSKLWKNMKESGKAKKLYIIGTNGNNGEAVGSALAEAMAYIPAPDGTMYLNRMPGTAKDYPIVEWGLKNTDTEISSRSKISAVDLFMDDEKEYRRLETEVLKEFAEAEEEFISADGTQRPAACIVGESALNTPENVEIIKQGIVIWCDVDPEFSWRATQDIVAQGAYVQMQERRVRPPMWALAQGWEDDPDDGDAKVEYTRVVNEFREEYKQYADIRIRTDTPGIKENVYWAAERLIRAMNELLDFTDESSEDFESELFDQDLEKFLTGARLAKYLDQTKAWCEEKGCVSIAELTENLPDLSSALALKPLEKKRLDKAAAAVAAQT